MFISPGPAQPNCNIGLVKSAIKRRRNLMILDYIYIEIFILLFIIAIFFFFEK